VENGHELQLREENNYTIDYEQEFQGFYFGTNRFWESNLKKMVNPADATEEKFFYEDRVVTGFQGFMTLAPCEAETGEECIKTGPLNEYNNHTYGFSNAWIQLNSSTTTNYIGLQELVNTTTYDYDNDLHKQVTKATTTDSRNKLLETIYEYAHEINNTALLNDNRIALPLKVTKKEDNVVISTRNTIYTDFGGLILPQLFQASFGSDPLEDKLQIISYDANGNVEELIGSDGKTTSIIWAYNGKLPVLKAEGARLDEITTALGDTITFGADNGNTFSASQHADLREIGGALVTVYAYDPGIGMTSQIDPNGRIITYTYDNFNRLVNIKDHDGNILRTFEYHVKTEQQ
jgi:YD repeat-containing protein